MNTMPGRQNRFKRLLSKDKTTKLRIPQRYATFGIIILSMYILGGGLYNILENPPAVIPYGNRYLTLHPYGTEQTVYESVFVMITNSAMFVGLWLCYRASQILYDRTKANRYMYFGVGLAALGFMLNYVIIQMKANILS